MTPGLERMFRNVPGLKLCSGIGMFAELELSGGIMMKSGLVPSFGITKLRRVPDAFILSFSHTHFSPFITNQSTVPDLHNSDGPGWDMKKAPRLRGPHPNSGESTIPQKAQACLGSFRLISAHFGANFRKSQTFFRKKRAEQEKSPPDCSDGVQNQIRNFAMITSSGSLICSMAFLCHRLTVLLSTASIIPIFLVVMPSRYLYTSSICNSLLST